MKNQIEIDLNNAHKKGEKIENLYRIYDYENMEYKPLYNKQNNMKDKID